MAINVEVVENTFDTGGDTPTSVKQLKVTTPYAPEFFLDMDEGVKLIDAVELALVEAEYWEAVTWDDDDDDDE